MNKLTAEYLWLNTVGTLPRMVVEGLKLLGTVEHAGARNCPAIMAWADECDLERVYTADSIPWCGLWMRVVAKRAGKDCSQVTTPLWALSWGKFGYAGGQPRLGDILVFKRNGGGHVGLYIGEDSSCYHVLGGNQSDAVTITRIQKVRLHAVRRLYRVGPPASAKPYVLAATGTVSRNEA